MGISVESRSRLWGRSGRKCAICKENLFEIAAGYDTVGEEAHSSPAQEALGPFSVEPAKFDHYSNLILLCPRDRLDAQPVRWTVERLLRRYTNSGFRTCHLKSAR